MKYESFEIILARKLQARSKSLHKTFLDLDRDRDGHISRSDFKIALHNIFGIDLTTVQLNAIFSRFAYLDDADDDDDDNVNSDAKGTDHGIKYVDVSFLSAL